MDSPEIFPLYVCKEPAGGKISRKYFERNPNETAQNWDWKEEVLFLVLRKKLNCQSLLLEVVIHTLDADYWSAVPVRTQRVLQLLTSTWQSHVSL